MTAAVAPVAWVPALAGWLVTGYPEADRVLSDATTFTVDDERFSTARLTGPSMLTLDGAAHRRHRAAFAAAYRPRNVTALAGRIRQQADLLVGARADPGALEVGTELARPLAVDALIAVLELPDDLAGVLIEWHRDLVDGFAADGDLQLDGLLPVVQHMRSRLGTAPTGPAAALDEAEYAGNVAIMLIGGIETVEGMIAYAARYRYGHPAGRTAPVEAVIEESLRLEPSAAQLDRYATTDATLAGADIRQGDLVIVSLSAAHRDPRQFSTPDDFDPTRWLAEPRPRHLAFAVGPHFCLGAHLARLETVEALAAIDRHLPGADVRWAASGPDVGTVFRRPDRLVVEVEVGARQK